MIQLEEEVDKVADEARKNEIFQFKVEVKEQSAASLAFIAFFGPSSIFLESTLKPEWQIGTLNFSRAKQQALANIYFHEGRLFVVFKQDFSQCIEYHLGEFFFDHFKFEKLIVIDWRQEALSQNKGSQLRHLKTSMWTDKSLGSVFNGFINGPTASLLVEGETRGVGVIHYIGVVGDYQISRRDLELFSQLEGYQLKVEDPGLAIKKYNQYRSNSRLYI